MYKRLRLMLLLVLIMAVILLGCTAKVQDEFVTVKGQIHCQAGFDDIKVYINNILADNIVIENDGSFLFDKVKKNDVISFFKEGYEIRPYVVKKDIDGLIIIAQKRQIKVDVSCVVDGVTNDSFANVFEDKKYFYNDLLILNCPVKQHYTFDGIYENDTLISYDNLYSINLTKDVNYTIKYTKIKYDITFSKNFKNASATCPKSAYFGDDVVLCASDDNNFVFAYWLVNNIKITDKTYTFALDNENTQIEAIFLKRLISPTTQFLDNTLIINPVDNSTSYNIYIDDILKVENTTNTNIDFAPLGLMSGRHKIEVEAVKNGFGNSLKSKLNINYLRPLDAPKDSGFIRENGKVYYTFSRVLCATNYQLLVNDKTYLLSDIKYEINKGSIRVCLDTILLKGGTYQFSVRAIGGGDYSNSAFSNKTQYVYKVKLPAPTISLDKNIITFSHEMSDVTFDIVANGVLILKNSKAGQLDLSKYIEDSSAKIKVVCKLSGYENAVKELDYIKY